MSRARDWKRPDTEEILWFDVSDPEATTEQLEALADVEGCEIDDLIDERLSQRAVHYRLNLACDKVPLEIIAQKRSRSDQDVRQVCRICPEGECEGRITRHHFVPRWLMLELENYRRYAPRSFCTIPVCVGRHRELHRRDSSDKSIAPYLTQSEKELAEHLIQSLKDERPVLYDLIAAGDSTYEYALIRDFQLGRFH